MGAAALIVMLLPAAAASADVTFSTPAGIDGTLSASGLQWAVLVVMPDGSAEASIILPTPYRVTNATWEHAWASGDGNLSLLNTDHPDANAVQYPPATIDLHMDRDYAASLLIVADHLSLAGAGPLRARLSTLEGRAISTYLAAPRNTLVAPTTSDQDVVLGSRDDDVTAFTLRADGLRSVSWFGATTACTAPSCPDGGGRTTRGGPLTGEYGATWETDSYLTAQVPGGSISATFQGSRFLAGGSLIDLQGNGTFRLPVATGMGCGNCTLPADQTLTIQGQVEATGVHRDAPGKLTGRFAGNWTSAAIDEQSVDPARILGVSPGTFLLAGGAVAAGIGSWIGIRFLLGLLTKPRGTLGHPVRKQVFEYIVSSPGPSVRELAKELGLSRGHVRHHLDMLLREGLIVQKIHGNAHRFFENSPDLHGSWERHAVLHDRNLAELHDWIGKNPGFSQKEILDAFQQRTWRPSVTRWRLDRLVHEGLVSSEPAGRMRAYRLVQAQPWIGGRGSPPVSQTA